MHPDLFVHDETHWIPKMFEFFATGEAPVDSLLEIVQRTYYVTGSKVTDLKGINLEAAIKGRKEMTVSQFCEQIGGCFARQQVKRYGPTKHKTMDPTCKFCRFSGPSAGSSTSYGMAWKWDIQCPNIRDSDGWLQPGRSGGALTLITATFDPLKRRGTGWTHSLIFGTGDFYESETNQRVCPLVVTWKLPLRL